MHTYNSAAYYHEGRLAHVHRKLYLPTYTTFEERKFFTPVRPCEPSPPPRTPGWRS